MVNNWQRQDLNSGSGALFLDLVQARLPFPPFLLGVIGAEEQFYGCTVKAGLMSVIW